MRGSTIGMSLLLLAALAMAKPTTKAKTTVEPQKPAASPSASSSSSKPDQATINENVQSILQNMGVQLSALGIDEFGSHFTPDYLAKRTHWASLEAQKRRFRSRLGTAMAESTEEQVIICPFDHVSAEAAEAVVNELRDRQFDAHWIRDPLRTRCPGGRAGFAYVRVPMPESAESP